jgi:hypothetical protein
MILLLIKTDARLYLTDSLQTTSLKGGSLSRVQDKLNSGVPKQLTFSKNFPGPLTNSRPSAIQISPPNANRVAIYGPVILMAMILMMFDEYAIDDNNNDANNNNCCSQ